MYGVLISEVLIEDKIVKYVHDPTDTRGPSLLLINQKF